MKKLFEEFTKEEIDEIRLVIFERETFFTQKLVDLKVLKLKTQDKDILKSIKKEINYFYKKRKLFNKFYNYLRMEEKE